MESRNVAQLLPDWQGVHTMAVWQQLSKIVDNDLIHKTFYHWCGLIKYIRIRETMQHCSVVTRLSRCGHLGSLVKTEQSLFYDKRAMNEFSSKLIF